MCTDCYTCAWCECIGGNHDDNYCQAKKSVLLARLFDFDYYDGVRSILAVLRHGYVC